MSPQHTLLQHTPWETQPKKALSFPTRPLFSYFIPEIIWKIKAKKFYPASLEHAWYLSIIQKMMGYHCWEVRHSSNYLTIDMIGSSPSSKELASEKEPADINCWLSYWANEWSPGKPAWKQSTKHYRENDTSKFWVPLVYQDAENVFWVWFSKF